MIRFPRALLLAALIGPAVAAAQPEGGDRRRTVGGWLVEDRAEEDGGRFVQLSRHADGARIRYFAAFWRGNDGRVQGVSVERSDCTNGEEIGRRVIPEAGALRATLAGLLAACAVAPRRIDAALAGFDRAYARALDWAAEAEAATAAEAGAIAAYGNDNAAPEPE